MDQLFEVSFFDPFLVAGVCAALMFACLQIGFRRGLKQTDGRARGSALIDEACLAILGLLLAFCFAAAYGKLDNRNEKILDDANAIRAIHFHCQMLPDEQREKLQPLIVDSVKERVSLLTIQQTTQNVRSLDSRLRDGETEMLAVIAKLGRDGSTKDAAASLMDAFHSVVGSHETRLAAVMDHVPWPVIALLILVASISTYLIGRSEAESGRLRRRTYTLILIVSAIVHVTLDLEQPLGGFIRNNHLPIMRLAESMGIKT
ncbi:MAG: hypothetical protein HZA51_04845 [Planctomycetes bacterium]|nr:hypothetical protein [Planctomycetota bacterium]